LNRLQNKFFASTLVFFSFLFPVLSGSQCQSVFADEFATSFIVSPKSSGPLHREWTSKNGLHKRTGTLTRVTETTCQISIGTTLKTIFHSQLSEQDQLFLAAMENVDLENATQVEEGLFRISNKFDYPSAVQQLIGRPIEVTTSAGVTYSCSELLELNPRRARFQDGKARPRRINLCDFDSFSKFKLLYNRYWAAEYSRNFKELAKVAKLAKRNYSFAWKNGLASPSYYFPTGKSATSQESWGLEWSPSCLSRGSVVEDGFSSGWSVNYFGGWENHDFTSAKRKISESKKRDRKLAAETARLKKKAYLASRSSYWSYRSSTRSRNSGRVSVKGYYRRDGTYVRPHTRSYPRR